MSIRIGKYVFEGPYTNTQLLKNNSGVYAILCNGGQSRKVVDIGESATVKERVDSHDRKVCWTRNCEKTLEVAVHYTPHLQQAGRTAIEQELRLEYRPPCGER